MPIPNKIKDSPFFYDADEIEDAYKLIIQCEIGTYFFGDITELLKLMYKKNPSSLSEKDIPDYDDERLGMVLISNKPAINFNNRLIREHELSLSLIKIMIFDFSNPFSRKSYYLDILSAKKNILVFSIECENDSLIFPPQGMGISASRCSVGEYLTYVQKKENLSLKPLISEYAVRDDLAKIPNEIRMFDFFYTGEEAVAEAIEQLTNACKGTYFVGNYHEIESYLCGNNCNEKKYHDEYLGIVFVSDTPKINFANQSPRINNPMRTQYGLLGDVNLYDYLPQQIYKVKQFSQNKFLILSLVEYLDEKKNSKINLVIPGLRSDTLVDFSEYLKYMKKNENILFSPLPKVIRESTLKDLLKMSIFRNNISYKGSQATRVLPMQLIEELDHCRYNHQFNQYRAHS